MKKINRTSPDLKKSCYFFPVFNLYQKHITGRKLIYNPNVTGFVLFS